MEGYIFFVGNPNNMEAFSYDLMGVWFEEKYLTASFLFAILLGCADKRSAIEADEGVNANMDEESNIENVSNNANNGDGSDEFAEENYAMYEENNTTYEENDAMYEENNATYNMNAEFANMNNASANSFPTEVPVKANTPATNAVMQTNMGNANASENEMAEENSGGDIDEAAKNLQDFKEHMANLLSGHVEAVFRVKIDSSIHSLPDEHASVVGFLAKGDYVHALKIKKGWVEIGFNKFIRMSILYPNKNITPGSERYKKSP